MTATPKYRVEHRGECKTYAVLYHTAWHLLDYAKTYEAGSALQLQACAVFCAFTFEAYLNHVGALEIHYWDDIERIPYRSKLNVIAAHLGTKTDLSKPPFQTILELFRLRDALAHGRSTSINETSDMPDLPPHDSTSRVMPWEKLTTEQLERYLNDVKAAVEAIDKRRKTPDQALWNQGARSRTIAEAK